MKKHLVSLILLIYAANLSAQTVAINNEGTAALDNKAMLEVRKAGVSKLKIRSKEFSDTTILELSNRNSSDEGTDFRLTSFGESGMVLRSLSDIPSRNIDSIITISAGGAVKFGSLKGTGTRTVTANANGQLVAAPAIYYVSIPAAAFQPKNGGSGANFTATDSYGTTGFTDGTNNALVAPVNLPHGATVTAIKVFVIDNAAANLSFTLYNSPMTQPGNFVMATVNSTGASGGNSTLSSFETNFITYPLIDNLNSTYYLNVSSTFVVWDANLRVKAVLLTYTL